MRTTEFEDYRKNSVPLSIHKPVVDKYLLGPQKNKVLAKRGHRDKNSTKYVQLLQESDRKGFRRATGNNYRKNKQDWIKYGKETSGNESKHLWVNYERGYDIIFLRGAQQIPEGA